MLYFDLKIVYFDLRIGFIQNLISRSYPPTIKQHYADYRILFWRARMYVLTNRMIFWRLLYKMRWNLKSTMRELIKPPIIHAGLLDYPCGIGRIILDRKCIFWIINAPIWIIGFVFYPKIFMLDPLIQSKEICGKSNMRHIMDPKS